MNRYGQHAKLLVVAEQAAAPGPEIRMLEQWCETAVTEPPITVNALMEQVLSGRFDLLVLIDSAMFASVERLKREFAVHRVKMPVLLLTDEPLHEEAMQLVAASERWYSGLKQAEQLDVVLEQIMRERALREEAAGRANVLSHLHCALRGDGNEQAVCACGSIKVDVEAVRREYEQLLRAVPSVLIGVNTNGTVGCWNDAAEKMLGVLSDDVLGLPFSDLPLDWNRTAIMDALDEVLSTGKTLTLRDIFFIAGNGDDRCLNMQIGPQLDAGLEVIGAVILATDSTELMILKNQLAQSRNYESVGVLASGLSQEISEPVHALEVNIGFVKEAYANLQLLQAAYLKLEQAARERGFEPLLLQELDRLRSDGDSAFMQQEVPRAFHQGLEGLDRIGSIVGAVKDFARPDMQVPILVNMQQVLQNMLIVCRKRLDRVAELEVDIQENLPSLYGFPSLLNQALLTLVNIVIDAVSIAFEQTGRRGEISLKARMDAGIMELRICGRGMATDVHHRLFSSLFVVRKPGTGVGQSLPMADAIVVKQGGQLSLERHSDAGATFVIRLPVDGAK